MKPLPTIFVSIITSLVCFAVVSIGTAPKVVWMNDEWRGLHPDYFKPKPKMAYTTNNSQVLIMAYEPGPLYYSFGAKAHRMEFGVGSDGVVYWRTAPEDQTNLLRRLRSAFDNLTTKK